MSYNYLSLVNEVNRRLNEVQLTSSTFATAIGFHSTIKDAVNAAIRDINHNHYEWPFNHVISDDDVTIGTTRYAFPTDANTIDFDSFRIAADTSIGNTTSRLTVMSYDDYLQNHVDQEYNDNIDLSIPKFVFHAPGLEYGLVPPPDEEYKLIFEYYRIPVDMEKYDDVPSIPERFKHVIIDGAMYHAYMFRSNEQAAGIAKGKFEDGLKKMRIILINKNEYMRSTAIVRG